MRIPSTYTRNLFDVLLDRGIDITALVKRSGVTSKKFSGQEEWVDLGESIALMEACDRTLEGGWHLQTVANLDMTHHGPLGTAAATAPTLMHSLNTLVRFVELRAPFVWLSQARNTSGLNLTLTQTVDLGSQRESLIDITLVSIAGLIQRVHGPGEKGLVLMLDRSRSTYDEGFEQCGFREVVYDAELPGLVVPIPWLAEPNPIADATLHEMAIRACEMQLKKTLGRSELESQVRQLLVQKNGECPGLSQLADQLNMSTRTLIRRLRQEDTSYQLLVDDVHVTLARHHLEFTDRSVAQIGYQLGFADPSNFGRAFRSWTGTSPGAYRTSIRRSTED